MSYTTFTTSFIWRTLQKGEAPTFPLEGFFSADSQRQVAQTSEANSENSLFRCGSVAPKMKTGRLRTLGLVIDINKTPFLRFQREKEPNLSFQVLMEKHQHMGFPKMVVPNNHGFSY